MRYVLLFLGAVYLLSTPALAAFDDIDADNCSAATNGENNTVTVLCGEVTIVVGYTIEQFEARLAARTEELRTQVTALQAAVVAIPRLVEDLRYKEADLADAERQMTDISGAFKQQVVLNEQLRREIERLRDQDSGGVAGAKFDAALAALTEGRREEADNILALLQNSEADRKAIFRQASIAYERGRIAEAEIDYKAAAEQYERATQLDPENVEHARKSANFASILGDYDLAVFSYRRIIKKLETETDSFALGDQAGIYTDAAIVFFNAGYRFEAYDYFQNALAIIEDNGLENMEAEGKCLACLALIMIDNGDFVSAKEYLDRSLAIARGNEDEVEIANVISKFGSWEYHQERYAEAIDHFEAAIKILRDADKAFHPDIAIYLNNLGFIHDRMGKPCLASQHIKEALAVLEAKIGVEHPDYREVAENLSSIDQEQC